jgi:3-oxoadipate enol-lactonase
MTSATRDTNAAPVEHGPAIDAGRVIRGRAVARDGTQLAYEYMLPPATDSAPTALVLGPLGLSSRLYGVASEFAVAAGYAVLMFDNRGCGQSDIPLRPWTMRTMAEDAVAVLDALGVRRVHVCGPSLGGFMAQEIAIRFPSRVGALVLASTTGGWPRIDLMPWRYGLVALARLARRAQPQTEDEAITAFLTLIASAAFAQQVEPGAPAWGVAARLVAEPRSRRGFVYQLLAGATFVGWPRLGGIAAPTLVQHGTDDRIVPVAAGRRLASRLQDAAFVPIHGAGHALVLECPEQIAETTVTFLRAHDDLL